jgi:shikimate 5-dehydrogenase
VPANRRSIVTQERPTMYFIGVSTAQSSIMKIFPLWMKYLGHSETGIEGVDLKIQDEPENYRRAVAQIKYDPLSLGALVTTHKISLLQATRDFFDFLDPYARVCGEVSSISKNGRNLEGHAKDPITAGLTLEQLQGPSYFKKTGADVLSLGGGGAATAIALHFMNKGDQEDCPRRMLIVDRLPERLSSLSTMISQQKSGIRFEFFCESDSQKNDALLATLPPGSLVINATGMGKDLPGSPITTQAVFPDHAIVWELNYRGELQFLHQAIAQRQVRHLKIEDGWTYFLHGWTQVISQVLKVPIEGPLFNELAVIAAKVSSHALAEEDWRAET